MSDQYHQKYRSQIPLNLNLVIESVPTQSYQNLSDLLNFNVYVLLKDLLSLNGIYRVLMCLQKIPYKPLHKASKLYFTMKTPFLLALATTKRSCKIHVLAINANHLRLNQSDGSVLLTIQTGLGKKSKYVSLPRSNIVSNLARNGKREHLYRLSCTIIALKFYLGLNIFYFPNIT